jgi:hypothetical protein
VWQDLRNELRPQGLEIVTVALDANVEGARGIVERVNPNHPSLIDQAHSLDALFGVVNVPSGIWIDEQGMIVRPPEPAFGRVSQYREAPVPETLPAHIREMRLEAKNIRAEPEKYVAALRDWVARGNESSHALSPDEVITRSRPRPVEEGEAAARFELGEHLHRLLGDVEGAARNWREAHRLQPDNWTYKRQAWSLADPAQGPTDVYEGDWLSDVRKVGAENYYPPLEM